MAGKKKFDYAAAMAELEKIAAAVEDPAVGIDDIDRYIKRSKELVDACRVYLRTARERLEQLDS